MQELLIALTALVIVMITTIGGFYLGTRIGFFLSNLTDKTKDRW